MSKNIITNVKGRMVFDSRGNPTVEAEVQINNNYYAKAISPSGASKGKNEAIEKRDNDKRKKKEKKRTKKKEIMTIISSMV